MSPPPLLSCSCFELSVQSSIWTFFHTSANHEHASNCVECYVFHFSYYFFSCHIILVTKRNTHTHTHSHIIVSARTVSHSHKTESHAPQLLGVRTVFVAFKWRLLWASVFILSSVSWTVEFFYVDSFTFILFTFSFNAIAPFLFRCFCFWRNYFVFSFFLSRNLFCSVAPVLEFIFYWVRHSIGSRDRKRKRWGRWKVRVRVWRIDNVKYVFLFIEKTSHRKWDNLRKSQSENRFLGEYTPLDQCE